MFQQQVKIRVPATTANCGPGYDCMGIACNLYNELSVELIPQPGLQIIIDGEGKDFLPRDERNIVYKAMQISWRINGFNYDGGLRMTMFNNIPLSRGLGSSAAAVVAGLAAGNALSGGKMSKESILCEATKIEGHPDNVAPAIFGGVVVSVTDDNHEVHFQRFLPTFPLQLIVAIPAFNLPTKASRQALPKMVSLKDAVYNVGRTALFATALLTGNCANLQVALQDRLHQPYREKLIPGMNEVFSAAVAAGASGAAISGAGSCLMAYATSANGETIGCAMQRAFADNGIEASYRVLAIDENGAEIQ